MMDESKIKPGVIYETVPAGRYGVSQRLVVKIDFRRMGAVVFYRVRRADGTLSDATRPHTMSLDRFARSAVRIIG